MVMKRNMMRRNLRRSIWKSLGRYIAIALIIALGTAIFVGLRSTKSDMVATGQIYTDEQNMFDLRLISSYGWDHDQLEDISQLEGIEDRNQAELMRGGSLWVPREEAVRLEEDEFYLADFVGALGTEEDGTQLGQVKEILQTGSNEVLAVQEPSGRELLIPVIRDCIRRMDAEEGLIVVHLLEGLRS